MRMRQKSKEDTIALYRDELLKDKSIDYINKFNQKDIDKQYQTIANWKRSMRNNKSSINDDKRYSFANFIKFIKEADKEIENLTSLAPKETEKAIEHIDLIKSKIINFEKIKKQRVLDNLIKEEELINKKSDNIRKKIADLKKELE